MPNQARTPFIRLYYNEQDFTANIDAFNYKNQEESSDQCTLTVTFDSLTGFTMDMFKDKAEFQVVWGYVGEKQTQNKKIYLRQKIFTYGKQISVDLIFTDKAFDLVASTGKNVYRGGSIVDTAKAIAEKHNLSLKVEIPNDDGVKTLTVSEIDDLAKQKEKQRQDKIIEDLNKLPQDQKISPIKGAVNIMGIAHSSHASSPVGVPMKDFQRPTGYFKYSTYVDVNQALDNWIS